MKRLDTLSDDLIARLAASGGKPVSLEDLAFSFGIKRGYMRSVVSYARKKHGKNVIVTHRGGVNPSTLCSYSLEAGYTVDDFIKAGKPKKRTLKEIYSDDLQQRLTRAKDNVAALEALASAQREQLKQATERADFWRNRYEDERYERVKSLRSGQMLTRTAPSAAMIQVDKTDADAGKNGQELKGFKQFLNKIKNVFN